MEKLRINEFRKRSKKSGISVKKQLKDIQDKLRINPDEASGVYVILSKVNDFIYIGSAGRTFSVRWKEHINNLKMLRHSNGYLQFLYCKYGLENLDFFIIETCPPKDCLKRESYYVHKIIPELNLNALIGTTGFNRQMSEEWDNWYLTKEGKQYKRQTLTAKREKWIKTSVGRECAQQDIMNLRKNLNESNKTLYEKTSKILEYCREYFPDLVLQNEVLINFINHGTHFDPIWNQKEGSKPIKTKPGKNNNTKHKELTNIKLQSPEEIKQKPEKEDMPLGCVIIAIILFLFSLWIFYKIK